MYIRKGERSSRATDERRSLCRREGERVLRRSGGGVTEFGVPAKYHSEARTLCGVSVRRGSLTPMSGNGSLFSSMSATSLLGGVLRNERPETISVKQAEARGMTARLFASLFCHGGSCSMAAKPLFLPKVFSKKPKSIIQKGHFEKTFATIFNFFLRFEFSQNEACAYRKGASVRKYVDDRLGWSCVCGRVPCRDRHSGPACQPGIIRTSLRAILFGAFAQPKLANMYTIACVASPQGKVRDTLHICKVPASKPAAPFPHKSCSL